MRAPSGQGTQSLTQRLRKYDYKVKGRKVNFTVWDTPGWTKNDYRDGVMNLILNGSVRDRTDITKSLPTSPTFKGNVIKADADLQDAVHVIVFLVPAEAVSDEEYTSKLLELKEYARTREMPVVVFLTKIDEYEPGLVDNLAATFHSERLYKLIQELSLRTGVPRNAIVPVKNFCTEFEPGMNAGILILRGVYEALNSATDFLREADDGPDSSGEYKKHKVRAKKDFEAEDPEEYLSLKRGKVYWQLGPPEDGWVLGGLVEDPAKTGLFPQAFVEPAKRLAAPTL
eukprot:jgi/Botrbrau1/14984/Bobra.0018s0084.1